VRLVVRPSRYLHFNAGAFVSDVVLTHADWDHVLGPEHLPTTTIVAHASLEDDLDGEGIRAALARLEQHAGIARDTPFEPPHPDETFTEETTGA
jgi:glyoxylase-like metal-dependent hydrolase (beta-lactamase superfamily II)